MADWNTGIIEEFRANNGHVGGNFEGAPLLLLHSTGAKSGAERTHPVMYLLVDGGWAVFASKAGADSNPDWYYNLVANPKAKIELGTETLDVVARIADADERAPIWSTQKERFPGFAGYEQKTTRQIPVVILNPAVGQSG
jgi:deazaflavin-dependent oxidoreductase (nitroreductase family)